MTQTRTGVLLIHGLTGSPHEFATIGENLRQLGYQAHLVTLPGHGDNPSQRFHETSALEILDHCAAEYDAFSETVDHVYVVGHSLGGVCSLLTASVQPPKLKGVVVFSAPYEHAYFYNYVHGLARIPLPHLLRCLYMAPRDRSRFTRPACKPWNMPRLLQQSRVIFSLMKEQIQNISVPVSLVHSLYDLTIPHAEMEKLARHIGNGRQTRMTTLTNSGHRIFPVSRDMPEAERVILDFIEHECAHLTQQIERPTSSLTP